MVICYKITIIVLWIMCKIIYSPKVKGRENIPNSGPAVICCNHVSNMDIPLVVSSIPRVIRFMAKEEMFETPISKFFYTMIEAFPVKRGKNDVAAIKKALGYVKNNSLVAIYPEGTRGNGKFLQKGKNGAAFVAIRGRVPLIPIGIKGSYKKFTKMEVNIGKPLNLNAYYNCNLDQKTLDKVTFELMSEISNLCQIPIDPMV